MNTLVIVLYDVTNTSQTWLIALFAIITLIVVTWRTWRLWGHHGDHVLVLPILLMENIMIVSMLSTFTIVLDKQEAGAVDTYLVQWYLGLMLGAGLGYTEPADAEWYLLVIYFVAVVYINLVLRNAIFLSWITCFHMKPQQKAEAVRFLMRPL